EIASLNPRNPFYTPAYVFARASLGEVPCAFVLQTERAVVSGCTGFLRGNFLTRTLEISSLPTVDEPDIFCDGVRSFWREQGIWDLWVESFASETRVIPVFTGELVRRERCEYVLDLDADNPLVNISNNHRRNISRARKTGLEIRRTSDAQACTSHVQLVN